LVVQLIELPLKWLGLTGDSYIPRKIRIYLEQRNLHEVAEEAQLTIIESPIPGERDRTKKTVLLEDGLSKMQLQVIYELLVTKLVDSAHSFDGTIKVMQSGAEKIFLWGTDQQGKITKIKRKVTKQVSDDQPPPTP
jgi:hypothetical protein